MTDQEILDRAMQRAVANGYQGRLPIGVSREDYYHIIFSHDFAKAFWGNDNFIVGNKRADYLKEFIHQLQAMAVCEQPLRYLEKFFIEFDRIHYTDFVFGRDVILKTNFPAVTDSKDDWTPIEEAYLYHYKPITLVSDFWAGDEFASALLNKFPAKQMLLDLGTASGSVPLTMRRVGMKALGIEGLPVPNFQLENYMLKDPSLFAWKIAPEIVATCDITQPFQIQDGKGNLIEFDYIISTDCFEHLKTDRIPILIDNIFMHLAGDGYGIFEINTAPWMDAHQTVQSETWWKDQFRTRFRICEQISGMDFPYVRSNRKDGVLKYKNGVFDPGKILFWVKK